MVNHKIITLTGTNNFLLRSELKSRVRTFVQEHGDMALEQLDGEETSFDRIRESLQSVPFLASKKLVVLHHPSAQKEFIEKYEQLLGEITDITELIIVEPAMDKRLGYYKFLKKETNFIDCTELEGAALAKWASDYANEQKGELSFANATYLINRVGVNQRMLQSELDKLLAYVPKITKSSIDLLCESSPQSTVFELIDAAFAGNVTRAMSLYAEQRRQKTEPYAILGMIAWQLHILAVVKAAGSRSSADIARAARLNPFVVRKSQGIAVKIPQAKLARLIKHLKELDVRLKSERIDADDALQYFLLSI